MPDQTDSQPELDLPDAPVRRSTGKVFDTKHQFTLPLTRSLTSARVVGRWAEADRKLWVTLVSVAFDELSTTAIHTVSYHEISKLFKNIGHVRNGSKWIIESAQKLHKSVFQWENENEIATTTLLSGIQVNKKTGEINFAFDPILKKKLLENEEFSRLKLHFMIGLVGKYSVSFYMLMQASVNLRRPVVELKIDDLRTALSVDEGKLSRWVDLEKNAILPAITQINNNSEAAGFSIRHERIVVGGRTVGMRFKLSKAENDLICLPSTGETTVSENHFPKPHPAGIILDEEKALSIIRKVMKGLDAQAALADFRAEIVGREIDNIGGYLTAWCKRRAKNAKSAKSFIDKAADARRVVE